MDNILANAHFHWKFFNRYFADAACSTIDAVACDTNTRKGSEQQGRFVRSAIIHCALALESVANCCLDIMQLQKASHEDFDKNTTLAKLDIFLSHVKPRAHLDREHKLVRPIRNLIACRNLYVHSKVLSERVEKGHLTPNVWEPLGLPHNPAYWQPLHAVKTFTVLSDFLNYFFFEACGYPYEGSDGRSIAVRILSSGIAKDGSENLPGGVAFSVVRDEVWAQTLESAQKWDLEYAFLGVQSTRPDNEQMFPKRKWGDYSHCKVDDLIIPWRPIVYPVPDGLGLIMVGSLFPQKGRKAETLNAVKLHELKSKDVSENTSKSSKEASDQDP